MAARSVAMFLLAAAACGLLTSLWIRYAQARQILDQPGQRRLHAVATPRGGGIAIALVLLAGLMLSPLPADGHALLVALCPGIALFALLGLSDDLLPVSVALKFLLQLLAAAVLVAGVVVPWSVGPLAWVALVVVCCYIVNIWNFMDGSNGLIAMQSLVVALALAAWPGQTQPTQVAALLLAGACLGFLPFNFPKARVFLGDVGSHALGAAIFALVLVSWRDGVLSLVQGLMLGTAMLLDSGLTLIRRALAGKTLWRAHREHLYQYAVRTGHSPFKVCIFYTVWTLFMILLAHIQPEVRSSLVKWVLLGFSWLLGTATYIGLRRKLLAARKGTEMLKHE